MEESESQRDVTRNREHHFVDLDSVCLNFLFVFFLAPRGFVVCGFCFFLFFFFFFFFWKKAGPSALWWGDGQGKIFSEGRVRLDARIATHPFGAFSITGWPWVLCFSCMVVPSENFVAWPTPIIIIDQICLIYHWFDIFAALIRKDWVVVTHNLLLGFICILRRACLKDGMNSH